MDQSNGFLGRGFSFPPQIDKATGRFIMADSEEDIKQAIYIILKTRTKERAMMPEFGCDLDDYLFELPDDSFASLICNEVEMALAQYEPRIRNVTVSVEKMDIDNGKVYFKIDYFVRATNNPNNLVFPYYVNEGIGQM